MSRTVGVAVAGAVAMSTTVVTAHFLAIDRSAQEIRASALVPPELPARVLVVVARPGQELTMAGTLAELDDVGAEVSLLSLTRGEAEPPQLDYAADRLAGIRSDELSHAADLLGVDGVTIKKYPEGGLLDADPAKVTRTIAKTIAATTPSVVLTVADLTGSDGDSQAAAAYTLAAAQAEGSGVARIWTVTRGDREVSWNPGLSDQITRHPEAQVSVLVGDQTATKGEVLLAHGTQSPDLADATYPYANTLPAWAYFRFWDREYFAMAWGDPLE